METHFQAVTIASTPHFNGSVPIKRARMELTTTSGPDVAQIRRQKEADKKYGRGKKISGEFSDYNISLSKLTPC
jgi:hypothetical protein